MVMEKQDITEVEDGDLRSFWIASYPKSGNTWVRLFLSSYAFNKPADINNISAVPYIRKDYFDKVAGEDLDHTDLRSFGLLKQAALWRQLKEIRVRPLVMKTHDIAAELNGIPLYHPNLTMGSLYIIRDPRDLVISLAKHMGCSIDEAIDGMKRPEMVLTDENMAPNFISSWDTHVKSWTTNTDVQNCYVLRYEDLYDEPEKHLRKVLELVLDGHEIDEDRFRQALESTTIDKLQTQEEHGGFREASKHGRFFEGKGGYGKWKKILTEEQVLAIESAFAELMTEFDYELNFNLNNVRSL